MRQCIFCSNKANSKEHIWSEWILDLLPDAKDGVFTRMNPDGTRHSRNVPKPDQRVKVVCNTCNNNWMSAKLEGPMKSLTEDIILINKKKTFSPDDCRHIAEWGFKTTILANHTELRGEPFFSDETRYAFKQDQSMPTGVNVWISQRNAGHLTATYRSVKYVQQPGLPDRPLMPHLAKPPESPYRYETYACTFSIGYLLVQVIAARWAERKVRERLNFPTVRQTQIFDNYASAIWPNKGVSVNWPPPIPVGNDIFESFCDRFSGGIELPYWMALA